LGLAEDFFFGAAFSAGAVGAGALGDFFFGAAFSAGAAGAGAALLFSVAVAPFDFFATFSAFSGALAGASSPPLMCCL
jgi:hypothetical protein